MPTTILHVSWYRFGRRHHPAIWQMIVGLARHFRTVVLGGELPGYFDDTDSDANVEGAAAGIEVQSHPDLHALRQPQAASIADALQRRWGRIDAVVGHYKCGALAVHLARELRVPVLAVFHGDDANIALRSADYGADYAQLRSAPAARFLGVSRNLVERLRGFGMPPERTFLHHLGIDFANYPARVRSEIPRPIKIAMAAQFRPSKGHAMAIRGCADLIRTCTEASLHFFGGSQTPEQRALASEMATLAQHLGVDGAIHFHGAVAVDVLEQEFANADIAIQPSVSIPSEQQIEGVPNAVLEAMATGLPVIATRHGGIPEAVLHERTGLLVDEHDHRGLAHALLRLAGDRELRLNYGSEGREWIEREFNSIRQSEILADHIRAMIRDYSN